MSYATLEKKIKQLPEAYLDEVSDYIEYILFKINAPKKDEKPADLSKHFGAVKFKEDGLEMQRRMRDEWD